jgi:hypothetical protein
MYVARRKRRRGGEGKGTKEGAGYVRKMKGSYVYKSNGGGRKVHTLSLYVS